MNLQYKKQLTAILAVVVLTGTACGQNAKVKTITIINGDTTISEKNMDEKELAEIDKQINIMINDDGDTSHTKIVKKIIINDKEIKDGEAMAYAYSIGDGKDDDVEITTDNDGKETKIIIKKDKDEKGNSNSKEKKTIIRKSMFSTSSSTSTDDKKESMKLNITVKNKTAKVEIESGSKEPLNVSVLDENGKQVFYDSQKSGGKYLKEIPLEKKGTYFLNIIQNKKTTNDKIIIE